MFKLADLEAQLAEAKDDIERIDLLNEIGFVVFYIHPQRFQEVMEQATQLLLQHADYAPGRNMLGINQGIYESFDGDPDAAIYGLTMTLEWCRQHQHHLYLARNLIALGMTYAFSVNQAEGLEMLLEALVVSERFQYRYEQITALLNIGVTHAITELPERMEPAMQAFQKVLELSLEDGLSELVALAQNNISTAYDRMGQVDAAIESAQASLTNAKLCNYADVALLASFHLATLHENQGNRDRSDFYLTECATILEKTNEAIVSASATAQYYFHAANIYTRRKDWPKAERLLLDGLLVAQEKKIKNMDYQCHELLATVYQEQGDNAQALEHYRQFHRIKESIFSDENELKFKRLSASFQLKQAQAEAVYQKTLQEASQRHIQRLQLVIDELEAFSYSVSHDLRAPLRSMLGFSQILQQDYSRYLDDEGRGYLQRVIQFTYQMDHLIDALLRLSRIARSKLQISSVDLTQIASDVATLLSLSEPTRKVEWVILPVTVVQGDYGLLKIALENLLNNAWKYTSKRTAARIEFGCTQTDQKLVYYIRDNGAGFNMAFASKLFKGFQRLHRSDEFEGTGIGLATVHRIIQRHGGRIWAEAAIEQGATFYFTLGQPVS